MTFGLTAQGFNRKTYEVIVSEMQARARNLFGDDINLADNSPLGLFIFLIAYFFASGDSADPGLWELAEEVYNSGFIDTAEGEALDKAVKYKGIKRNKAEPAYGENALRINGVDGTVLPAGWLVATPDGIQFKTLTAVAISSGTATAHIQAVNGGSNTNVPAGTITVIVNPTAGVTSVTNTLPTTGGKDAETDEELRERYYQSVAGASSTDAIRTALLEVSGVRDVIVRENDTNSTDSDGLPAKCIAPIVLGGTDADVAQTIFKNKAGGIQSYGTTNIPVTDLSGRPKTTGFTRPTVQNVWVNANLTTDSNFPTDGDAQVKTQIIKYIGGTDADSTEYDGLGIDDDVIWVQLLGKIQIVPGITDVSLTLSTDGTTFSAANISITGLDVARTDSAKVVVS